ncbi:MAG: prepilin-type N-terminal cleavage/methylation domain-containing protein [Patescibacteria group bacterium]
MKMFNKKGFTLIEIIVVVSIIGFLATTTLYYFGTVRMGSRDLERVANIKTINKGLAIYINEHGIHPQSDGECLSNSSPAGALLVSNEIIFFIPFDPTNPGTTPESVGCTISDGYVQSCPNEVQSHCYWYTSSDGSDYYISYYLEINSDSGDAGPHAMTPAGIN